MAEIKCPECLGIEDDVICISCHEQQKSDMQDEIDDLSNEVRKLERNIASHEEEINDLKGADN